MSRLFIELKSEVNSSINRLIFTSSEDIYFQEENLVITNTKKNENPTELYHIYILVDFEKRIELIKSMLNSTLIKTELSKMHIFFSDNYELSTYMTFCKAYHYDGDKNPDSIFQFLMAEVNSLKNTIQETINSLTEIEKVPSNSIK